jgi:glyoxalase family protein
VPHQLLGLHHVTATAGDAQADLDFCLETLGLRLVKKTVNFDNHGVYHFYYGTERGAPGTIWTTFPYKGRGVRVGQKGAGQVIATAFSVPAGSLEFWQTRLAGNGVATRRDTSRFGDDVLRFDDPSGLWFELIATADDSRAPWTGRDVSAAHAIRGLHSVTLSMRALGATRDLMTDVLGFTVAAQTGNRTRFTTGGTGPGHIVDILAEPEAEPAVNGLGTVHHVAMAIGSADEQIALREDLLARGVAVTEIRDRSYFQSIYFCVPGGVLFEVATMQPGFSVDEDLATLGQALKLPSWEEHLRPSIEAGLEPIVYR